MTTLEKLKALRDWYSATGGTPAMAFALSSRQLITTEERKRHFESWKNDPATGLDDEDLRTLEVGGTRLDALQELHELTFVKELTELVELTQRKTLAIFRESLGHAEPEAPVAPPEPPKDAPIEPKPAPEAADAPKDATQPLKPKPKASRGGES